MNIAIDGYEANSLERVGIGRYAFELLQALYTLVHESSHPIQVTVFVPDSVGPHMPQASNRWHYTKAKQPKPSN